MSIVGIAVVVIVIAVVYLVSTYNRFVTLRNRVKEAWSDVQVQIKRRYDLIPNLVNTVKGYAQHESQTLEKVIQARNMAMAPHQNMKDISKSENFLSGTLKSLFALSENYPELKANQNFLELQHELRDTEDKLQAGRRFYNGNVLAYNTQLQQFPSNIVAGLFRFEKEDFFEIDEAEKATASKPVQVNF